MFIIQHKITGLYWHCAKGWLECIYQASHFKELDVAGRPLPLGGRLISVE